VPTTLGLEGWNNAGCAPCCPKGLVSGISAELGTRTLAALLPEWRGNYTAGKLELRGRRGAGAVQKKAERAMYSPEPELKNGVALVVPVRPGERQK